MKKTRSPLKPLAGRVALVAGATRGAGRGVARALAEAGATVYCTGRSVKGKPSPYCRPETIDETAAMITAAGGKAIAVRVDHTSEVEVKALFRRIRRAHKRIDVVVDSVAGEDPLMGTYGFLWQADLEAAGAIFRQGLTSRIITAKHAALAMMPVGSRNDSAWAHPSFPSAPASVVSNWSGRKCSAEVRQATRPDSRNVPVAAIGLASLGVRTFSTPASRCPNGVPPSGDR